MYQKAFLMILNYVSERKDSESNFNIIDEMKLNRIFFICNKKIIKNYCFLKVKLPVTKIHLLLDVIDGAYSNWFNYLIFLLHKYKVPLSTRVSLNKPECESQTSVSSIEKEPSSGQITKDSSRPEFNKSGSGNTIFKLYKTSPFQNYDKEKLRFKTKKKRSLRNLIKKKIPDYYKYISVLNENELAKMDGSYSFLIFKELRLFIFNN